MKILFAPFITRPGKDASYFLTCQLAAVFQAEGHIIAVCAPSANHFQNAALYDSPSVSAHFHKKNGKAYETMLYNAGALDQKFLEADLSSLLKAINHFKPDLIITMHRPCALASALLTNTKVWTIVESPMYLSHPFPSYQLHAFNLFLSAHSLVQVLNLHSFYEQSDQKIGIGSIETQPWDQNENIFRIGSVLSHMEHAKQTNRVCIYLGNTNLSDRKLKKVIQDAFAGAPYAVYACMHKTKKTKSENIQYLEEADPALLNGAIAVIHDGNAFFYDACNRLGIPQIILTDKSASRSYYSKRNERNHTGTLIEEERFSMSSLYENYRKILSDDAYWKACQDIKEKTARAGSPEDLNSLLNQIETK